MELRLPDRETLKRVYEQDLREAFPPVELKPLYAIERAVERGVYRPYCLFEDGGILGECFLWEGHPGWAIIDYLSVRKDMRNRGLGAEMLRLIRIAEPDMVIFVESEAPEDAPDPDMAERRLAFYSRCGLRQAGYDSHVFGVHYRTLCLPGREAEDSRLMAEHAFIYASDLPPERYARHIRIPWTPGMSCSLPLKEREIIEDPGV